jgi:hypothetical protein
MQNQPERARPLGRANHLKKQAIGILAESQARTA